MSPSCRDQARGAGDAVGGLDHGVAGRGGVAIVQGDADQLVLELQALVAPREVPQQRAGVGHAGMRRRARHLADGVAAHQAVHGGDRRHAALQDAVQVVQHPAADHGHAAVQRRGQALDQHRAAAIGPHLFGARHDRSQGAVEIQKQRRRGRGEGGRRRQVVGRLSRA
jgi:hypothetical protein